MDNDSRGFFTVIGGANVDLMSFSRNKIINGDSNPGRLEVFAGGVSRNIAENLIRLNFNVNLISAFGRDIFGDFLLKNCIEAGIKTEGSFISDKFATSTYSALIDNDGDMYSAVSSMDIIENIPESHIEKALSDIKMGDIIIDANIPENIISIIAHKKNGRKIYADAVSTTKAHRFSSFFEHVYLLKLNEIEASYLSELEIKGEGDLIKTSEYFLKKGVKKVIITCGGKGVFYADSERFKFYNQKKVRPVNATGAGDAFLAAFAAADTLGKDADYAVAFAQTCAKLTLLSKEIVCPRLNFDEAAKEAGLNIL